MTDNKSIKNYPVCKELIIDHSIRIKSLQIECSIWYKWVKNINMLLVLLDFSNQGGKIIITATFKSLYTRDFLMHFFANGEDPVEMLHHAAFHQSLHCLLRQRGSSEKEIQFHLEIICNL